MLHLKKFLHFYLLIFLNIIFVLLRLPDFYRPLWNDELITLRTVLVNPLENPLYNGVSTNLPLFYYLVKLFSFIFEGDNLRIISLICSILILNIFIFRYLKEKDLTYIIAGLFITFSPIQIYYSTELRTYIFTELLLVVQFFFLKDFLGGKKVNLYLWSLSIFLSLISHYTAYIFVFSSGLYLLLKEKKISESILKAFIFPSTAAFLVLITISGNYGFSDSTERSILNMNFQRFTLTNIQENFLRLIEVITIYYNFGLHYYRIDSLFTSLFKKFIYFFFLIPVLLVFIKDKFKNIDLNISLILLGLSLFISILFDLSGFLVFAGRYIFPFQFLYILIISVALKEIWKLNHYLFIALIGIFLLSYNLYNSCLIKQLNIYKGNQDPQGVLIQSCFK